ncbi:HDOD domain-containing protein [Desulfurivibrio sp. D14AmB]|uniref:HDOD domain-containing protein n=1 Tax=Desulfurivibrio sp. D14AmB TaxID=3374370 RepID=UPI00376EABF8
MSRIIQKSPGGLGSAVSGPFSPRDLLLGEEIMASPPSIYLELSRVLILSGRTIAGVAGVIEQDAILSARLLALVNRISGGPSRRVATIAQALELVGLAAMRHLVLATLTMDGFRGLGNELEDPRLFWRQGLLCALIGHGLGARVEGVKGAAEILFAAGLLHRLGDLIILRRVPELAREALFRRRDHGLSLAEAERSVLGFDYGDVGAALAERWLFPPGLIELLAFQQRPERALNQPRLCALLHLAVGMVQDGEPPPVAAPCWPLGGVTVEILNGARAAAESRLAEIAEIYNLPS